MPDIDDERQVSMEHTQQRPDPISPPSRSDPDWLDRLVDMHVLSEHGDVDAAAAAQQWLDSDPEARRVWGEVQRTCECLHRPQGSLARAEGTGGNAPATG